MQNPSDRFKHFIRAAALAAFVVLCSALPFLPGPHFDGVLTLALLAQIIGLSSVVLVPAGLAWLALRLWKGKPLGASALYLVLVPSIALIAQIALAERLTARSRTIAIENSVEIIRDIEAYRTENGQYPASLLAVWPDYSPGIVGIQHYRYEPHGAAYNLAFEQPRFLLDDFGAREFVIYNPRDEHAMTSHAMWRLSNPELQGWFAVHDAEAPHWKYFLFD